MFIKLKKRCHNIVLIEYQMYRDKHILILIPTLRQFNGGFVLIGFENPVSNMHIYRLIVILDRPVLFTNVSRIVHIQRLTT